MWSTRNCCRTWGQIKLEISQQIFERQSKIKFQENSSNGNRVFLCGTDDRRADMTRITVAFHSFANVPNNKSLRLQDTFLTMHGYVFTSRNLTMRCTLLISKLQCHINETVFFFWSVKFALTCLGNALAFMSIRVLDDGRQTIINRLRLCTSGRKPVTAERDVGSSIFAHVTQLHRDN